MIIQNEYHMVKVDGITYIFDLEAYHNAVKMPPRKVTKTIIDENGVEKKVEEFEDGGLNVSKYELLKFVLEIAMDDKPSEDIDSAMGMAYSLNKLPFSFKVSFNTLLGYGILKAVE